MASRMAVQSFATKRNSQVELFIEYVLENYCTQLINKKIIKTYEIENQIQYQSSFASDIWDHRIRFFDQNINKKIELWCQTTCYKGNETGKPESNKTYEVRETLVEAISIREIIKTNDTITRTLHFTVGPSKYAYDWFSPVKKKTFDLSLNVDSEPSNIFNLVGALFNACTTEQEVKELLNKHIDDKNELGIVVNKMLESLFAWHHKEKLPVQELATKQYEIVKNTLNKNKKEIDDRISSSTNAGQDIKGRCTALVYGAEENDPIIISTTNILLEKNPFIKEGKNVLNDWRTFSSALKHQSIHLPGSYEYIKYFWERSGGTTLVIRRLLFRTILKDSTNYIQDINIEGVTEHNLYNGKHSGERSKKIAIFLMSKLKKNTTSKDICDLLISSNAKKILRECIWFESRNGANLKPSFDYIIHSLESKGYLVKDVSQLENSLIGYHANLVKDNISVNAYNNIKGVCDSNGKLLAYLKGKFFRHQEFPRRCKEEAYIALTLKNSFNPDSQSFKKAIYVPVIMYIDMEKSFSPPHYALRRLEGFGWSIAFSCDEIIKMIGVR